MKTFKTPVGDVTVNCIGHASLQFLWNGRYIYVDPYTEVADYSDYPKADLIIISHNHYDHLDIYAIRPLTKSNTKFVCNPSSQDLLKDPIVLTNGDEYNYSGLSIKACPAYNIVNKNDDGEPFHPKGEVNGYILNFNGFRIYIAGDTEFIPEMRDLEGMIDLAFLPKNLPYTMRDEEFAEAANAIMPKYLYAYHYFEIDPAALRAMLDPRIVLLND